MNMRPIASQRCDVHPKKNLAYGECSIWMEEGIINTCHDASDEPRWLVTAVAALSSGISGSSLQTAFRCYWMTSTCAQGDGRGWPNASCSFVLHNVFPGLQILTYSHVPSWFRALVHFFPPQQSPKNQTYCIAGSCSDAEKEEVTTDDFRDGFYLNLHLNLWGCYWSIGCHHHCISFKKHLQQTPILGGKKDGFKGTSSLKSWWCFPLYLKRSSSY